jgi:hypothetical protein
VNLERVEPIRFKHDCQAEEAPFNIQWFVYFPSLDYWRDEGNNIKYKGCPICLEPFPNKSEMRRYLFAGEVKK